MSSLARRVAAIALEERLVRQITPHSALIRAFFEHALLQQISEAARNTGFLLSRFDGRRTGHVFLERNSNIARFRSDNTCLNKSSRRAALDLLVKVRQLRNSLAVTRAVALSQGIIAVTRLCELTVWTNAGLRVQTPK